MRAIIAGMVMLTGVVPASASVVMDNFEHGGGCYARTYDNAHMRSHPDQVVRQINLEGSANDDAGSHVLYVELTLRNGERYGADAYCTTRDRCSLEGDGGSFSLSKSGKAVKLTVGDFLSIEGSNDFSPDLARTDDRVFLIDPC